MAQLQKLKKTYVILIASIIVLMGTSQLIVHNMINSQTADALVVNVSGRQRMLSQNITKLILVLQNDSITDPVYVEELRTLAEEFTNSHKQLSLGSIGGRSFHSQGNIADSLCRAIDPMVSSIAEMALAPYDTDILLLLDTERSFLPIMDQLTSEYQIISESKLDSMRMVEIVLSLVTIVTLFVELKFIIIPLYRSVSKSNKELLALNSKLKEANSFKTDLLENLNHEFRTPLNSITNFAQFLEDEEEPETRKEYVHYINQNSQRLYNTLNGIIDLAQYDGSKSFKKNDIVSPSQLIDEILHSNNKESVITANEVSHEIAIISNLKLFEILLTQIINNAFKFTNEGEIIISLSPSDGSYLLKVEDTGIGIAPGFLPDATKAFTQESKGHSRTFEGMGIGLAICQQLSKILELGLELHSNQGKGTTVIIRIPSEKVKTITQVSPSLSNMKSTESKTA